MPGWTTSNAAADGFHAGLASVSFPATELEGLADALAAAGRHHLERRAGGVGKEHGHKGPTMRPDIEVGDALAPDHLLGLAVGHDQLGLLPLGEDLARCREAEPD